MREDNPENSRKRNGTQTRLPERVGVFFVPARHELSDRQIEMALHRVSSSSFPWVVFGGKRTSLALLFETGKVARLDGRELLEESALINETARVWARQWCDLPAGMDLFFVSDCNIGQSLYREIVFYFLAILKPAYFLTKRLSSGTIAQCVALRDQDWVDVPPEKLQSEAARFVGQACGVRWLVVEEEKTGWKESLKRRLLWVRDALEKMCPAAPAGRKVLVSSSPTVVGAVMENLMEMGHRMMVLRPILGWKPLWRNRHRHVLFRVYRDYMDGAMRKLVAGEHERIQLGWETWVQEIRQGRIFDFCGIDWWDAVRPQFEYYFSTYFSTLFGYVFLSQAVLTREAIGGILVDEDVCEFNRTLVTVAGAMSIPSVVIQHGAPFQINPTGYAPVSATRIAAWGRYSQDLLRSWGVPQEKICLTGVPRYDSFQPDAQGAAKKEVAEKTGASGQGPLILYACDPPHREGREDYVGIPSSQREEEEHLKHFLDGLGEVPEVVGIVKLHPKDADQGWAERIVRSHPVSVRVAVLRLFSTPALLRACDVFVTMYSTVAIEAMLLGKPVVTINCTGQPDIQPHAQLGAALPVRAAGELGRVLRQILTDTVLRAKLKECAARASDYYIAHRDGQCTRRVAQLLDGLMRK